MAVYDYDIFVIGGGSGGVRAARLSAAKGLRVGLAEEYRMGGTCVIRGCVPKKLFAYAASYKQVFADSAGFGWRSGRVSFDWGHLRAAKDKEIARLEQIYTQNLQKNAVDIFPEKAVLRGKHKLRLASGRVITAKTILIAVGARPFMPNFPGADLCLSSNEIFNLSRLPKSIVIVGGGYIAVEFSSILHGLGVEVTLVYRGDMILRRFDNDLRRLLQEELQNRGIRIICNAEVQSVTQVKTGSGKAQSAHNHNKSMAESNLAIKLTTGELLKAGEVLLALGRKPNIGGLGLEQAGVALNAGGAIAVDAFLQTSAENIYAVGDVTGRVELTPVAIHEAMCFVKTVVDGEKTAPDYSFIPTAVFSEPEIGTIGLSEGEAAAQFPFIEVYRAHFKPMRQTISGGAGKMLMKLLVNGDSGMVVGAHILGEGAAEMVQLLAIAIRGGVTKAGFDATMALHPSAAEELVTMYSPSYVYRDNIKRA